MLVLCNHATTITYAIAAMTPYWPFSAALRIARVRFSWVTAIVSLRNTFARVGNSRSSSQFRKSSDSYTMTDGVRDTQSGEMRRWWPLIGSRDEQSRAATGLRCWGNSACGDGCSAVTPRYEAQDAHPHQRMVHPHQDVPRFTPSSRASYDPMVDLVERSMGAEFPYPRYPFPVERLHAYPCPVSSNEVPCQIQLSVY